MKFGVIGAGFIGRALARLAVANGHEVMIANSRGPQTLTSTAIALHCKTGTVAEAAAFGDVVVLAIPLLAIFDLDPAPFEDRIVIDANNYYPHRDGAIELLDRHEATTSGLLARQLPGAKVVKAFNAILQDDIEKDARPAGAPDRRALPIAGDDPEAKRVVAQIVNQFGFDPFDAGSIDESWRFERAMPCYCAPLGLADLQEALGAAQRGVEVPYGSWRARREAAHAQEVAARTTASPERGSRHPVGSFEGRGHWDIVDTQFHLGPDHGARMSLAAMDALGIASALIDEFWYFDAAGLPQPCAPLAAGGFRPLSPLASAASLQFPARLAYIQRIERADPLLLSQLPLLAQMPGCRSLRINLLSDDERQRFAAGEWDEILAEIQRLDLPLAFMSPDAGALLEPVAQRFAGLRLIVDHCGWIRTPDQWQAVLGLARHANVHLKWSHAHRAFRRFEKPEQARSDGLLQAVDAFGAQRVMWAGDASFEESPSSWSELLSFVRDHPRLSDGDRAWVLGKTARAVHRWEK